MFKLKSHKLKKVKKAQPLFKWVFEALRQYFPFVISFSDVDFHELCQKRVCLSDVFVLLTLTLSFKIKMIFC